MSKIYSGTTNPDSQIKLAQLQVERIKDEEEQWISGEELYTEGSSDDDDAALRAKRRHDERQGRVPKRNPKTSSTKNKSNLQEQKVLPPGQCVGVSLPENVQSKFETMNIAGAAANAHTCDAQHPFLNENDGCDLLVEIDDSEISWRPKRDTEVGKLQRNDIVNFTSSAEEITEGNTVKVNTDVLTTKITSQQISSGYLITEETAELLQGINKKLKVFSDDECDIEEFFQENPLQEFSEEARERLRHVNKQLGQIDKLAKDKKLYPLGEGQIQDLLQKTCLSLNRGQSVHLSSTVKFSKETCLLIADKENLLESLNDSVLEQILQEANMEMPHFQYRYLQK